MVSSNYPDVKRIVQALFDTFDSQQAKYPNQPLQVNVKEYPSVLSNSISNQYLDETGFAMSLNDVYLGSNQSKMRLDLNPIHIEPAAMARESVNLVKIELQRREVSIPNDGILLLEKLFFGIYGRRSDLVTTNIYHPESIVMFILNDLAPVSINDRTKSDMLTKSLNNYPVVTKFDINKFKTYMAKFDNSMGIQDIFIRNQKWKISLNDFRVDFEAGGIWDRNSRTFGTWSPFPREGDDYYGMNLAGYILGVIDNQLTDANLRKQFVTQNWERRIFDLCLSATMNAYTYSYIIDVIKPS